MNIYAKCANPKCSEFGFEKSVAVGQLLGFGVPKDRVKCPVCHEPMTTTKTERSLRLPSRPRAPRTAPTRNERRKKSPRG
jgi:hypothetical protein